jgi:uncharacterized protein (TIGR02284 family)
MADDIINTLKDLVETSKDGERGFMASAEDAKDPQLKRMFEERARECASAAGELSATITRLGGDPPDHGTVGGAMHRGWMHVKTAMTSNDDQAILDECERGEDVAKKKYTEALKERLPDDVRMLVQRQYEGVLRNHDQIKALRDSFRRKQPMR